MAPTTAERVVDDLPGFYDAPPGSPMPPAPAAGPAPGPAPAPEAADDRSSTTGRRRRRGVVAAGVAVVAVVTAVVVVGTVTDRDGAEPPAGTAATTSAAPRTSSAPSTSSPSAPLTAAAAGDLADLDLPAGDDGFTGSLTSTGVVLEPQAVGVTVAYPQLTVSSDGTRAVAHLDLAVWNCLGDQAPADPAAADCRRVLAEFADLGSPDLQVTRTSDGLQLSGTFATYTRPNGSAPVYTGRSYPLEVQVEDATGGPTGTLRLGSGAATVVPPGELVG
ncbi:hypothetical protein [Klenkia terrae]|uniref:hypothetical protein n=1 Tax=Klenkia terrae TaxID=1052259 RepID=UPI001CD90752|nr:hypothetical protein [Klenkia terrae]